MEFDLESVGDQTHTQPMFIPIDYNTNEKSFMFKINVTQLLLLISLGVLPQPERVHRRAALHLKGQQADKVLH